MDKKLMGHWLSIEELEAMEVRTRQGFRMEGFFKEILGRKATPLMLSLEPVVGPSDDVVATGTMKTMYPSGQMASGAYLLEEEIAQYATTGIYHAAQLIDVPKHFRFSRNFKALDFWPPIEQRVKFIRVSPLLVQCLEEIREVLGGVKVTIISGYRPPAYNQLYGGSGLSAHADGLAADIRAEVETHEELLAACDKVIGDLGGVGNYSCLGYVHIDVRGYRSRWVA